jgi:hypothetical protein
MVLFRGLFSVIGSPSNVGFSSSLCSSTESQVMSASALLHRFWLLCATSCSSLLTGDESEDEENILGAQGAPIRGNSGEMEVLISSLSGTTTSPCARSGKVCMTRYMTFVNSSSSSSSRFSMLTNLPLL